MIYERLLTQLSGNIQFKVSCFGKTKSLLEKNILRTILLKHFVGTKLEIYVFIAYFALTSCLPGFLLWKTETIFEKDF
jgi:hypothetical protein